MTLTSADIGKLVRVGDVPEGGTVEGLCGDVYVIGETAHGGMMRTLRLPLSGESRAHAGVNFTMRLHSLPAEADRAQHRAEQPATPKPGDVVPCGELLVGSVVELVNTYTLIKRYAGGWVGRCSNMNGVGTASIADTALVRIVSLPPVAPGEIAPRLTVPTTHPCPERASCIAETAALRVRVDAAEAEIESLRERVLELDAQRDNAAAIGREAVEAMDAAGMQRDAARRTRDEAVAAVIGMRAEREADRAEVVARCADVAKAEAERWSNYAQRWGCDGDMWIRHAAEDHAATALRIEAAIRKLGGG